MSPAPTPRHPQELVEARAEYERASSGPAGKLHPAQVYEARQALDKAEAKFNDDATSQTTKDLAYVALRKVQYAEAMARVTTADERLKQADKESRALDGKALESAQAALKRSQEEIDKQRQLTEAERVKAQNAATDAEKARQEAEQERQARLEAEKRMKQALEDLAKIAAIKEEQRGMVITLTGNVLFESGKWALLPGAQIKLNEVAEALKMNKRPRHHDRGPHRQSGQSQVERRSRSASRRVGARLHRFPWRRWLARDRGRNRPGPAYRR